MNDIVKKIYAQMLSDENRLLNGAMKAEEYKAIKNIQIPEGASLTGGRTGDNLHTNYGTGVVKEGSAEHQALLRKQLDALPSAKDLLDDSPKDFLIPGMDTPKELQIDYGLIGKLEGNVLEANVPDPEGSKSGVTVGTGVDLGEKNRKYFAGFENQELLDKFDQYYGLQGMEAYNYEQQNPLTITQEESDALNAFIKGKTTQTLRSNFEKTFGIDLADLPPELQTVVGSIGYQYGPSFMIDDPKTKEYDPETPAFVGLLDLVSKNPGNVARYEEIVEELRDFGDRYGTRRKKEADYLQTYIDRIKK